jgi:hypothetical protein
MNQVPLSVDRHLDQAMSYLSESRQPYMSWPERYKLVIKAWRSAKRGRDELDAWTYAPNASPYKTSPGELRLQIMDTHITNGKADPRYYGLADLNILEDWLENGHDRKTAEEIFESGWHFDSLERFICQRVDWDRLHISMVSQLA